MSRRYDRQFRAAGAGGGSIAGAQVTLWDAATGGTQLTTGITTLTGDAIAGGVLTCDSYGYAPAFIDTASRAEVYAIGSLTGSIPGVDRVHLEPTDTDDRVAAVEAAVAALAATVETAVDGAVQTAGGSIITIGEGDTTTQALIIHLPTGDRSSAPDTFAAYVNVGTAEAPTWRRTFFLNESGMLRVIAIARSQTPVRIKGYDDDQTANLTDWTDLDNIPHAWVDAAYRVRAPNLGKTWAFSLPGELDTVTGSARIYNDTGVELELRSVRASVGTAPTGASILIDVNVGGTTIFTTQANRPTIAAAGHTSGAVTDMDVAVIADGDYITVDVDQVGSSVAGSDLVVQVEVY